MGRQESSIEDARKEKKKKSPEQDERAAVGMPSPSVFLSPPSQFSDEGRIPVDAVLLLDTEPGESWMLEEWIDGLWRVG